MIKEKSELTCPSCNKIRLHPDRVMNALSRRDNKTYICSDCGTAEALKDFIGEVY